MNIQIVDLNISYISKDTLLCLGFTNTSELSEYDYFSLLNLYPDCKIISKIFEELSDLGYILPQDSGLSIYNVPMSKRLQNTLKRNHILYLSQLSTYAEETILQFRNLGSTTMNELKNICKERQILIRSLINIKENLGEYYFSSELYYYFFNYNITTIDDFRCKTTQELYNICNKDYLLTMKTYNLLMKNNIKLKENKIYYLFEVLPTGKALILWKEFHIKTVEEFYSLPEKNILHYKKYFFQRNIKSENNSKKSQFPP